MRPLTRQNAVSMWECVVVAAQAKKTSSSPELFSDISILRRKWQAALKPGMELPFFEDVMLGSLGRLADHTMLIRQDGEGAVISRAGRYVEQWLDTGVWDTPLDGCPPDCALTVGEAITNARSTRKPYLATGHCVRDGLVRIYDVLALPVASRWGGVLVSVYVNQRGSQYNLLDAIFRVTDEGIVSLAAVRDAHGKPIDFQIVHLNQGTARLLQRPVDELRWQRLSGGTHALCSPQVIEWLSSIVAGDNADQLEVDDESRTLTLNASTMGDLISLSMTDVTHLKRREQSSRLLFENNPMPMWVFDVETRKFRSVNEAALSHYGYDRETFLAMELRDLWPKDEWEEHQRSLVGVGDIYDTGRNWRHLKADGSEIEVLTFGRRLHVDERDSFLVSVVDITERRKAEARVAYMAHHDALTDLANRVKFHERLRQDLERTRLVNSGVAVLCIDLDLFKNVNDSFGHPVGDRLLRQVAERLTEFAMILAGHASPNEASDQAAAIIEMLSAPYTIDGLEIVIGASVGIAISPGDGESSEELLRNADMALYRAKSDGGGVYRFFEKEMDRLAQRRRDMEIDLRRALATNEFELHYQPLVDLAQDRIVTFEALLRWKHPVKGMISPADFIPVAEDIGLIVSLGSRNLTQVVFSSLAQSGLSPTRLELEITESILLEDSDANLSILHQLREFGVRISMDDFGTGYSSLNYLRSFPFDKIKIDRSFIRDLSDRPDSGAIVRAISGLGRSLNISTTAEGVETMDQLDWLRAEGCTEVQGFLFSPARPASEIAALLGKFGDRASKAA